MAKKTVEHFYSDLSNEEIDGDQGSLQFAFDGTAYEIDLTTAEREKFEKAISKYVDAARKVASGARRTGRKASSGAGPDAKTVRAWAAENDIDVPARGRIPAAVIEAFESAN